MIQKTVPSILVTGATGAVGGELVKQLSAANIPFRALVRQAQNTGTLPATEIAIGDMADAGKMGIALEGIKRVFLLTHSSEQAETIQGNFVEMARRAGVKHIVKLSQLAATPSSPVRFLRYHAAVEQKIQASGLDYTFLRPNLYMQGLLGFRSLIAGEGKFFASIGDARISAVDIRDIAAVALAALTRDGHENKRYDLTGPAAPTHREMAMALSGATGKEVRFIDIAPEEMLHALLATGFPAWQAEGLIEDYAHYARGEASAISPAIPDITGFPARGFGDFARDYAPAFS